LLVALSILIHAFLLLSGLRPKLPRSQIPESLATLMQQCWHLEPRKRPEFSEVSFSYRPPTPTIFLFNRHYYRMPSLLNADVLSLVEKETVVIYNDAISVSPLMFYFFSRMLCVDNCKLENLCNRNVGRKKYHGNLLQNSREILTIPLLYLQVLGILENIVSRTATKRGTYSTFKSTTTF